MPTRRDTILGTACHRDFRRFALPDGKRTLEVGDPIGIDDDPVMAHQSLALLCLRCLLPNAESAENSVQEVVSIYRSGNSTQFCEAQAELGGDEFFLTPCGWRFHMARWEGFLR